MFELMERFRHKIKSANEIRSLVGPMPRQEKVVMCHGVFDVVHPGHIRHFLFAKNKAPLLVVSLTADKHINKGNFRPHVPQDLRAVNLAALEFVDFVIIDLNEKPLSNIGIIKPDFFAKGFEYSPLNNLSEKTNEEIEIVSSYGGEVIFSPGDYVLSSSRYIQESPPNLKTEKLMMLMERSNVTFKDLLKCLDEIPGKKIHVVGDTIVDSYTKCSMIGGQTKTPTMSVKFENCINHVGGAGIVAAHLKAAGAVVEFTTVLGNDEMGKIVSNQLSAWDIKSHSIIDSNRPTTNKNAIVVNDYRLLKVDTVDNSPITDSQLASICQSIAKSSAVAVVLSDFRHGIFNSRTISSIVQAIPKGVIRVADSQVASRWGNILDFKGFDLITPNEREARFSLGDQDSGIRTLCSNLFSQSECKAMIMKLGERGIITCTDKDSSTLDNYFVMDSFAENLIDPVGAGDALLAYSTLAMLVTGNAVIASILGNLAAACECECDGNITITPDYIARKIESIMQQI